MRKFSTKALHEKKKLKHWDFILHEPNLIQLVEKLNLYEEIPCSLFLLLLFFFNDGVSLWYFIQ